MRNISDIIVDKILPSALHLTSISAKLYEGKMIVEIKVSKEDSLYYIKKYERSSCGCFVRIGTAVRGMTDRQNDEAMIKALHVTKPKITEMDSFRQDLPFDQFKCLLDLKGVHT